VELVIKVTVRLHTILQRQLADGPVTRLELSLPVNSDIKDLLLVADVKLPLDSLLILVNRKLVEPEYVLKDGDIVNLMPAISGGISQDP
jgi:molybdopterin converting factor small subunit